MKRIVLAILVIFLCMEVFTLVYSNGTVSRTPALSGERAYWTKRIKDVGAEAAFRELKNKYINDSHGRRHTMTHLFGEILFNTQGVSGVTMCDNSNEFGCFHGFFTTAVRQKGESIIHELDQACLDKYGITDHGCQHGIGHGILEYYGSNRLVEALDLCSGLTWKGDIGGCGGGVFMEYNMPTLIGKDEVETGLRPMKDGQPYEPCDSLPKKYFNNCLYNQVQWWGQIYDHDFVKLGQLCSGRKDIEEQRVCYRGIGQIAAPTSNYSTEKTIQNCNLLPSDEAVILCRQQASWSTYASLPDAERAPFVCEGMGAEFRKGCVSSADVEAAKAEGNR